MVVLRRLKSLNSNVASITASKWDTDSPTQN
ncbi:UNVERIFIED_CONTAM: hypothetical protein GTU68_027129 [Idotea baltica]|nr:hypothetical protein [Idotea baltica]